MKPGQIVEFLRKRDYEFVKELGRGACGVTVLLRDTTLDQLFVCKKYSPLAGLDRRALFDNFVREIKLLHSLNHGNVVRVFNYYLYPESLSGFILMERIDGLDVERHLHTHPEQSNEIFEQAIQGFRHLELRGVLHRDVRPANLLVDQTGIVKIIDFGFGKRIELSGDFNKSISLNWWCEPPAEFATATYDFATDVYFVGKLFQKLIADNGIQHFKYSNVLDRMCEKQRASRISSFTEVDTAVRTALFSEIKFPDNDLQTYRDFADNFLQCLGSFEQDIQYVDDQERILTDLEAVFRAVQLEIYVPDSSKLLRVFLNGSFTYLPRESFEVNALRNFLIMFKRLRGEKARLVLSNLHSRLDTIKRKVPKKATIDDFDDDIPF